ncbi:uncharacterized protein LOC143374735, partial [Andrena cerasifolii]|uniref:uncharacterized protein LOC143374735 n=1 Tax=Andrena cerasifolii TaxID=2819439 RepID=UPI00403798DC
LFSDSLAKEEEEPITGKNQLEDEVILLNKRQAWKKKNEEQLEEVAFGEDMRKGLWDKELFEKLTELDKKKAGSESNGRSKRTNEHAEDASSLVGSSVGQENSLTQEQRQKKCSSVDCAASERNCSYDLSNEDKLRVLEGKINVYSDNDRDTRLVR